MSIKREFFSKLISGYLRENFEIWTPDIIIHCIVLFCSIHNIIPCNVYSRKLTILDSIHNIINVFVNGRSMFCVGNDNKLYVAGDNTDSQLGLGSSKGYIDVSATYHTNELINNNVSIVSHGTKNRHTFVYTNDNKLYGMGASNEYDKSCVLGIKTLDNVYDPTLIEYTFNAPLIQIECGTHHSLFLDINGTMYGCGKNTEKQLSNKFVFDTENEVKIHRYNLSNSIIKIATGQYASYIINNKNDLYSFGSNYCGQLGIDSDMDEYIGRFNLISSKPVINVSAGSSHVIFLTENNQLFGFGYSAFGQCGSGNRRLNAPTKINICSESINDKTNPILIDIKCGAYHNVITTRSNDWYSFGQNSDNELLLNTEMYPTLRDICCDPIKIDKQYLAEKIGNNPIIDIFPGYGTTFILQKSTK